jgi:hypothetical protein
VKRRGGWLPHIDVVQLPMGVRELDARALRVGESSGGGLASFVRLLQAEVHRVMVKGDAELASSVVANASADYDSRQSNRLPVPLLEGQ